MAVAGIQTSLLTYKMEEAELTYELNNIMADRSMAMKKESALSAETIAERKPYEDKAATNETYAKSTEYATAIGNVEDNYELKLSDINNWEEQLQQQQDQIQTKLKVVQQYEENCTSMLKQNIKKDFSYGGSSSS
jgi:hypothetical protein